MKRYKATERHNIQVLLADRPHLTPVFSSTHHIPERVKEYDDELFMVFNNRNSRFEIHTKYGGESTYNATVPYKALDERTMRWLWRNDIRVHGRGIHDRLLREEEQHNKRKEKESREYTKDFAREFQSEFAKDAWIS